MDKDIIQHSVEFLPIEEKKTKDRIVKSLFKSIKGVFLSPLKVSLTLSTVTWVILDFFGVKYLYLYCFMAALITFLPLCSVSILGIPAAMYLHFSGHDEIWVICCLCVYYFITSSIFTDIYSHELSSINPVLLFLSLVNGLYVFNIKGFLYGPMLICFIHAVLDLLKTPSKPISIRKHSE